MLWYILFGVVLGWLVLSLILPTLRRMWAFNLRATKYLVLWLLDRAGLRLLWARMRGAPYEALTAPVAMRMFCEDMGPTYIKFGQIVASSAGVFPERYMKEFQNCLDHVRSFPFEEAQQIVTEELGAEKARELVNISPAPLASASIAQVHRAELSDGTGVVIKVQRPGIEQRVSADMRIMRTVAVIVSKLFRSAEVANPVGVVEDFAETLREEMDFRKEAKNLERFNEIMLELGHHNIRAPVPHWVYTTRRVLVMERFVGTRVDHADEIRSRGVDAEAALITGMRGWFQSVIFYGFFHGDVHAGNLMLLEDGAIGFLDFGIVGRFSEHQRWLVTDYLIAFAMGDYKKLAEVIVQMGGVTPEGLDMASFVADLDKAYSPIRKLAFGDINYASLIPEIQRVATKHHMTMPKEFILITKQLLYFDRYAKLLAPKLNVFTDPRLLASMMMDIQKARMAAQQSKPVTT